jgi:hypothetical protein
MHKAGCPVCNPHLTVPELNRSAEAVASNQRFAIVVSFNENAVDGRAVLRAIETVPGVTFECMSPIGVSLAQRQVETAVNHPAAQVAGDYLTTSLAQFIVRAQHLLIEEQEKPDQDNALVSFLCDAVRLARESRP